MKLSHVSDAYPRDGSDTIKPEMEAVAPTSTVGALRQALRRLRDNDQTLPKGYASYLEQRVPSLRHLGELPPHVTIDRKGRTHGA